MELFRLKKTEIHNKQPGFSLGLWVGGSISVGQINKNIVHVYYFVLKSALHAEAKSSLMAFFSLKKKKDTG